MKNKLNANLVKKYKLLAIDILQKDYVRPNQGQPLWVTYTPFEEYMNINNFLSNNCLPVHLAILPAVKKKFPNAGIVIGTLNSMDKKEFNELSVCIKGVNPFTNAFVLNKYHAWIKIDITDSSLGILDITSQNALYSKQGYLEQPIRNGHLEILKTTKDVYEFHRKYIVYKLGKKSSFEYLYRFIKQQNRKYDI